MSSLLILSFVWPGFVPGGHRYALPDRSTSLVEPYNAPSRASSTPSAVSLAAARDSVSWYCGVTHGSFYISVSVAPVNGTRSRTWVSVPSWSFALIFVLMISRISMNVVDELDLQDFNRVLNLLNRGNLYCFTCLCLFTEMLSTVSIDCTWCISTVLGEQFSFVTPLTHRSVCRCTVPLESRRACLSKRLILSSRIVDGSKLRIRHYLEDLAICTITNSSDVLPLDRLSHVLTHMIDLLMNERILSLHDHLDDLWLLHLHWVCDLFTGSASYAFVCESSRIFSTTLCMCPHVDDLCDWLVLGFAPVECFDKFHDSVSDLNNWYVHDLIRALCFANVQLSRSDWWIPWSVRHDLLIFLGLRHLPTTFPNKVTVQRVSFALRRDSTSLRCWWSLSLWQPFLNKIVNRDLVLLGRLRVLGQNQFLDDILPLHDDRDDLTTCISDLAVTQDQLLDYWHIKTCALITSMNVWSACFSEFSSRISCKISCGYSCAFLNVFLSPSSVVASEICCLNKPASLPWMCPTICLWLVDESLSSMCFWTIHGLRFRTSTYRGYWPGPCDVSWCPGWHQGQVPPFAAGVVLKSCGQVRGRRDVLSWTFCQMLELRTLTLS